MTTVVLIESSQGFEESGRQDFWQEALAGKSRRPVGPMLVEDEVPGVLRMLSFCSLDPFGVIVADCWLLLAETQG